MKGEIRDWLVFLALVAGGVLLWRPLLGAATGYALLSVNGHLVLPWLERLRWMKTHKKIGGRR